MTRHILAHTLKGHTLHVAPVIETMGVIKHVETIATGGFWRGKGSLYYLPSSIYTLEVVDEERYQELKRKEEVL